MSLDHIYYVAAGSQYVEGRVKQIKETDCQCPRVEGSWCEDCES
jgi:hypothetical protein